MPKTILIVDDDAAFVEHLSALLRAQGFQTVGVIDGEAARQFLDRMQDRVDVAVIDMVLPQLSGAELIGSIARRRGRAPLRLVATSSRVQPSHMEIMLHLGADCVMMKGASDGEWLEAIRGLAGSQDADAAKAAGQKS